MANRRKTKKIDELSLFRLRLGVIFIMIWWIPVYLAVPALIRGLGLSANTNTIKTMFIIIISVQAVLGVLGFMLVGRSLANNLRRVTARKAPKVFWRMLWNGTTDIPDSYLKKKR
jgi:hypothetical protein